MSADLESRLDRALRPRRWRKGALVMVDRGGGASYVARVESDGGATMVTVRKYIAADDSVSMPVTVARWRITGRAEGARGKAARAAFKRGTP